MPTDIGRAFTTANFLTGLPALKAINFGSADPAGVWFVVPNASTNNIEVWVWQPASVVAPDEISVVRPDSVIPGSPGRCIQSLKLDVSQIVGILGSIANLSTNGLIKKSGDVASTVVISAFGESLLDDADSAAGRATLGLGSVNNTADTAKSVASAATLTPGRNINGVFFNGSSNITLTAANLGLGSVDNTSDAGKPISSATQTALNLKANLASPTFTGDLVIPSTAGTSVGTVWRNVNNLEYKDSLNATQILLNSAGNLVNLSNKQTALNTLSGTQVANRVLRSDGTNVTLSQVSLTADVINILPATLGGSGQSNYTVGDILFASTSTALSRLANVVTGNTLISGGVGVAPSYGKVGLTTHISGILPISNGGTNSATQNFVDLTTAQTIGGAKTFSGSPVIITAATTGSGGTGSVLRVSQTGGWSANSPYALEVVGYSFLDGFRITGQGGARGIYQIGNALQLDFATNNGDITFTSGATGTVERLRLKNLDGGAVFTSTSQSTSSTTGALTVAGGIGIAGNIVCSGLPTSSAGLPSGAFWRNGTVVNIV